MDGTLATTNLLLGIIAATCVIWTLGLLAAGVMGLRLYRQTMKTVQEIEQRQVAPLSARVNDILVDLKGVTARVNEQTERVDHALRDTMDRVDETAERVKTTVRTRATRVVALVKALRAGLETLLRGEPERRPPPAEAPGRA